MVCKWFRGMTTLAAALAIGIGSAGAADEKPGKKPGAEGQGPSPERRAEMMKRFDKNGDGQLDDGEKKAAMEAMQKFRQNGGKPGEGGPAGFSPERMKELLAKFDKDGDGKLSESEREAAKAEFMKNRGPGGPGGKPGAGGKPGEGPSPERRAEMMKRFDKNGDGQLDEGEKKAAMEAMQKFRQNGGKPGEKKPGEKKPGEKKPESN